MKKILAFVLLFFVLVACSDAKVESPKEVVEEKKVEEKVRVGISWSMDAEDAAKDEDVQAYVQAILASGGEPVYMQQVFDKESAIKALAEVDCVVLAGGEDMAPHYYGEEVSEKTEEINEARDTSDFWLTKAAIEVDKPVMATCRGMQVLNIVTGGTLYQDIPTEYSTEISHRDPELVDFTYHTIQVEENNIMADAMANGAGEYMVNSWHHQSIDKVGDGLKIVAKAEDGTIEGLVYENASYIYGVQFHPEWHVVEDTLACQSMFQALMNAAKK